MRLRKPRGEYLSALQLLHGELLSRKWKHTNRKLGSPPNIFTKTKVKIKLTRPSSKQTVITLHIDQDLNVCERMNYEIEVNEGDVSAKNKSSMGS